MKKYLVTAVAFLWVGSTTVFSQSLSINTDGSIADASAMLDVKSTVKGLLVPRMTTAQRTAIATPATGLQVYDTDLNQFYFYSGSAWTAIPTGANANNYWTLSGGNIYNNTGTNVGIGALVPADKLEVNGNLKFTGTSNIYCGTGTNLTVRPGDGTGSGGTMTIRGGNAGIASGGAGGDVTIQAGANLPAGGAGYGGLGAPGAINILGSSGYNSVGGGINITAGASSCWSLVSGSHSDVKIQGGQSLAISDASSIVLEGGYTIGTTCPSPGATGGNLILKSGLLSGTGANGNIQLLNGNVGIGTSAPSSKLEVCGNTRIIGTLNVSSTITSSTGITCPSDIRYKTNITSLSNPMQELMQLKGVNYFWRTAEFPNMNFSDRMQTGFIAQDVEKIFPEMVFTDDAGYKSIDYSRLTPVLVETIKEQQQQINELFKRVENLEKKIK